MIIAYLMVSHVHYPDFKGSGEKIYLFPKIFAVIMFAAIVYFARDVIIQAIITAVFSTYAVFGIINSLFTLMNRE